jgi:para-aminobenzoate synthetase component 1
LNIAIRTIIITNHRAYAQTGGGIVADSDPEAEWDETITKAKALIAGIKAM